MYDNINTKRNPRSMYHNIYIKQEQDLRVCIITYTENGTQDLFIIALQPMPP